MSFLLSSVRFALSVWKVERMQLSFCLFFSLLLGNDEPCSEPSLEIRCVRDAVRDMSLELCPGNVNEGDCRQQRNSRDRANKGAKHTKGKRGPRST